MAWSPQQTPTLPRSPRAPRLTWVQAVCYHLAPLQAPSDNPATVMDARKDPAAGLENANSPAPVTRGESNARPQAQRTRAPRCAANNVAPGGQPAVTVPSRRGSDWRPGPTCLHFNSAPGPGAHSSSSASVHPSVRPRELASPAPPPAQGDEGFQHAPVLMESTMALTESVRGAHIERPAALAARG
jgi:hypothetical protein